jgi:hypothetical protein
LLVLVHTDELTIRLYHVLAVRAEPGKSSVVTPAISLNVVPLMLFLHWYVYEPAPAPLAGNEPSKVAGDEPSQIVWAAAMVLLVIEG